MAKGERRYGGRKRVAFRTRDEAMQALREALEQGRRTIARARITVEKLDRQLEHKPVKR